MSVYFLHFPTKCPVFLSEIPERHYLISCSLDLEIIIIHDSDEIAEIPFMSGHHRFPCLSLLMLTIRHTADYTIFLAIHLERQGNSHRLRKSMTKRSRRVLNARNTKFRMSLQERINLSKMLQFFSREETASSERSIINRTDMAI